ncbi:hypothetical protein HBI60_256340 [Parastagonospora nodorum]|nr:hypothetical protein HBI60_256340 [Parastagonospora nodorum]
MVQLRAPTQPPSSIQRRQLQILFRHPGYDDDNNVLFKLQAPDTDDHGQPGLLAQFAIEAYTLRNYGDDMYEVEENILKKTN